MILDRITAQRVSCLFTVLRKNGGSNPLTPTKEKSHPLRRNGWPFVNFIYGR